MNMLANNLFHATKAYHQPFAQYGAPIKQYLGAKDVLYLNVNKEGNLATIHSNYKWMEGYIEGKHYNSDPHLVHPDNISGGFCMSIIYDDYRYEEYSDLSLLYEPKNKFDYGFTYVEKENDNFTAFCFTLDKSNRKFVNTLLNQAEIIKFLIQKLEHQVRTSFPSLQQDKTQLSTLKGDLFFQQRGIIFRN